MSQVDTWTMDDDALADAIAARQALLRDMPFDAPDRPAAEQELAALLGVQNARERVRMISGDPDDDDLSELDASLELPERVLAGLRRLAASVPRQAA
jgi:hypothetical protein